MFYLQNYLDILKNFIFIFYLCWNRDYFIYFWVRWKLFDYYCFMYFLGHLILITNILKIRICLYHIHHICLYQNFLSMIFLSKINIFLFILLGPSDKPRQRSVLRQYFHPYYQRTSGNNTFLRLNMTSFCRKNDCFKLFIAWLKFN